MTCKLETAGDFPSPSFWLAAFLDCTDSSKQRARNKTIVRLSQRNIWWWGGGCFLGQLLPTPLGSLLHTRVGFPIHLASEADGENAGVT